MLGEHSQAAPDQGRLHLLVVVRCIGNLIRIAVESHLPARPPQSSAVRVRGGNTEQGHVRDGEGKLQDDQGQYEVGQAPSPGEEEATHVSWSSKVA